MRKLLLVTWHEYRHRVFRWRFLLWILLLPAITVVMFGLLAFMLFISNDRSPVGYVDEAGLAPVRKRIVPSDFLGELLFQHYPDETAARTALERGEIQAYYRLPADFRTVRKVSLVYQKRPGPVVQVQFNSFILRALLSESGFPEQELDRLLDPLRVVAILVEPVPLTGDPADGEMPGSADQPFGTEGVEDPYLQAASPLALRLGLPALAFVVLFISLINTAQYLSTAVVEEKTDRTLEILLTSLSADQLMVGKILAYAGVGLTQMLLQGMPVMFLLGAALLVGAAFARLVPYTPATLAVMAVLMLLTFLLVSLLTLMISSLIADPDNAKQSYFYIPFVMLLPALLYPYAATDPGHPLLVGFSLFPLTAVNVLLLRIAFGSVPAWQYAGSLLLLLASIIAAWRLAGWSFRTGLAGFGLVSPFKFRRPGWLPRLIFFQRNR